MRSRAEIIRSIEDAIGHRRLLWVGTRGTDAQPLLAIDQFEGIVGLISPLGVPSWPASSEDCLERISGQRVDLNAYSVDADSSEARRELGARLRKALSPGTVAIAYRPSAFLASAYFTRTENVSYLGMFHGAQAAFEHKPWVETELAACGVPTIPWRYFADDDHALLGEWVRGRRFVLRANYSDGGRGLELSEGGALLPTPIHDGGFIAAAPFLDPNVPLNVSGCVFPNGDVTVRSPSVQLIGIPSCTSRRFGYCGNDFATVRDVIGRRGLDELEGLVVKTGEWLHRRGYLGAFGIDALVYDGAVYLAEINPRFQGSSAAASSIMAAAGVADIYLDHLAALLGIDGCSAFPPLREQGELQAEKGRRLAQVVCYNTAATCAIKPDAYVPDLPFAEVKGAAGPGIAVLPEAMLFKIFVHDTITSTGFALDARTVETIQALTGRIFEPVAASGEAET